MATSPKKDRLNGPEMQWSGQRGSNPRPQPWQGCALPTEPCPHVVGDTRFELVTPSVSGKCSPPELIARLRCAPQRGINYSRAEFQMQQHFFKIFEIVWFSLVERENRPISRPFAKCIASCCRMRSPHPAVHQRPSPPDDSLSENQFPLFSNGALRLNGRLRIVLLRKRTWLSW